MAQEVLLSDSSIRECRIMSLHSHLFGKAVGRATRCQIFSVDWWRTLGISIEWFGGWPPPSCVPEEDSATAVLLLCSRDQVDLRKNR